MGKVRLTMLVLVAATHLACAQTPPTRPADGAGTPHWAEVYYKGGWASPGSDEGQVLPSRFTPPFHYRHPDGR